MINVAFTGNWGTAKEILALLIDDTSICVKFVLTQYSDAEKNDPWHNMVWNHSINNNIQVILQNEYRNNDDAFVKLLQKESVNLIVSCAFPYLIKKKVIDYMGSKLGIVNLHGSLLPKYRGTTPVLWAIINNDDYLGITLHYIDEGCDSGDIIYQAKIKNNMEKSLYELTDELKYAGCGIFKNFLNDLTSGKEIRRIAQNPLNACPAPRIKGSMLKIDFNQSFNKIEAFFKATKNLNPYFECKGEKYIVNEISQVSISNQNDIVQIKNVKNQSILISSKNGDIELLVDRVTNLFVNDILN